MHHCSPSLWAQNFAHWFRAAAIFLQPQLQLFNTFRFTLIFWDSLSIKPLYCLILSYITLCNLVIPKGQKWFLLRPAVCEQCGSGLGFRVPGLGAWGPGLVSSLCIHNGSWVRILLALLCLMFLPPRLCCRNCVISVAFQNFRSYSASEGMSETPIEPYITPI